jgi:ribosomal protein S27AE
MGEDTGQKERRRKRKCPSCGGAGMIRGCRVPGVQLQIVREDSGQRSGLIALYSDVCVDCGLTSFYARRDDVAHQIEGLGKEGHEKKSV